MGFTVRSGLGCQSCSAASSEVPAAVMGFALSPSSFTFSEGPKARQGAISSAPWASISMMSLQRHHRISTASEIFTLAEAAPAKALRLKRTVIKGDGRCLFRAMAQGLARNKGAVLRPSAEEVEADQLRLAVAEALCRSDKRRSEFKDAVKAVQLEDTIPRYCQRIVKPTFWGGEPEMMILSKMLQVPLVVYLPEEELGAGDGFRPIQKYGQEYTKAKGDRKARKPVHLLFCGGNHYDLLTKA